jgi:glucokinase
MSFKDLKMLEKKIIGVDVGGTKIHSALISKKIIIAENTVVTPSKEAADVITVRIIESIERVYQPGCEGIGIGVPSVVDSKKGIVYDTISIPSWKEVHLKKILENYFNIPVWVNNDSNCFALGEKYFGVGPAYSNFVGLTIGTGLGAGVIIDNKLYCGANTGAGEVGSIPYKDGIIEEYCASHFFISQGLDAAILYSAAKQGNKEALAIFNDFGKNLSAAIKIILYAYDPEMIVLGGSISNAFDFFIEAVRNGLEDYLYPSSLKNLKIIKSELVNSSILGAGALFYD